VISSRRLAREWALRILYQQDVGKTTLEEALESALERLRLEFVQRGSRTASGSPVEQLCLDAITRALHGGLTELSGPYQRALAEATAHLLLEAPYWQELRLEKAFKTQAPGMPLNPPRLLTPLSEADLLTSGQGGGLSPAQRQQLDDVIVTLREELPRLLEADMRQNARQFARELAAQRPPGATPEQLKRFLLARREAYNLGQQERWKRVATIAHKQISDWLHTAGFTTRLVSGAYEKRIEIDEAVTSLSAGWRLERQVAVDRNILRLAGYEILFVPGVPTGVSINEAVELAKKYSTAESGRFVNGVLGALAARIGDKPAPIPAEGTVENEEQDESLDLPDITPFEDTDTE
jgi:N utilization substance protein B